MVFLHLHIYILQGLLWVYSVWFFCFPQNGEFSIFIKTAFYRQLMQLMFPMHFKLDFLLRKKETNENNPTSTSVNHCPVRCSWTPSQHQRVSCRLALAAARPHNPKDSHVSGPLSRLLLPLLSICAKRAGCSCSCTIRAIIARILVIVSFFPYSTTLRLPAL